MNFKIVTSLNEGLYNNKAQQIINSAIDLKYPLVVYNENSYENSKLTFPSEIESIDLWAIPEYFWLESFIDNKLCPWNNPSLHQNHVKREHAKFWFRKVLSITHAILNSTTEYIIWCDGDLAFNKKLDNEFWDYVKQYDISCIWRTHLHIESGIVVYKINNYVQSLAREYLGFYTSGDVWKYPKWCDGSVLTYLLLHNNQNLKVGKFKHPELINKDESTSKFKILDYINHIKSFDGFATTRKKQLI